MKHLTLCLTIFLPLILLFASGEVMAEDYQPLVGIPGLDDAFSSEDTNYIGEYINAIFALAISIGGLIAVFKIIFAGAQYMLTDLVSSKESALKDIRGAFLGLLILLGMVLVFREINPNILRLDVFRSGTILQTEFEVGSSRGPITGIESGTNLDTINMNLATEAEKEHFKTVTCRDGNVIVGSDGTGVCRGGVSTIAEGNTLNTQENLARLLENNDFSDEKKKVLRKQYNEHISPLEPDSFDIEKIKIEITESSGQEVTEVLFVVEKVSDVTNITSFTKSQQVGVCHAFTDGDGDLIEIQGQQLACVR